MKVSIPIPKAAVMQTKRNMALDVAISALQERDVPDTNVGDMVSKQAAIDALDDGKMFMMSIINSLPENVKDEEAKIRIETICATIDIVKQTLRKLPSAQPEEASVILGTSKDGVRLWYKCSVCGEPANADDNYCCNCGRRFING
jgi:hypothetical protein